MIDIIDKYFTEILVASLLFYFYVSVEIKRVSINDNFDNAKTGFRFRWGSFLIISKPHWHPTQVIAMVFTYTLIGLGIMLRQGLLS